MIWCHRSSTFSYSLVLIYSLFIIILVLISCINILFRILAAILLSFSLGIIFFLTHTSYLRFSRRIILVFSFYSWKINIGIFNHIINLLLHSYFVINLCFKKFYRLTTSSYSARNKFVRRSNTSDLLILLCKTKLR